MDGQTLFYRTLPTEAGGPKITSDTISFSLHLSIKSNKSHEVKFVVVISKNPDPLAKNGLPLSHLALTPSKKNLQPTHLLHFCWNVFNPLQPIVGEGGRVETIFNLHNQLLRRMCHKSYLDEPLYKLIS